MSDTSIAAMSGTGPSFVSVQPDPSEPRAPEALMCVNKASEGGEGASGAGSEALVRRFSDSSGAGGGSGYVDLPTSEPSSCVDDALRALGACGGTALLVGGTAGAALLVATVGCVGNLGGFLECLADEDAAAKP